MNQAPLPSRAEEAGPVPEHHGRYAGSTGVQDRFLGGLFWLAEKWPGLLNRLSGALGRAVWIVAPGTRAAVRANLSQVVGNDAKDQGRLGRRLIVNFIRFVADLGAAQSLTSQQLVDRATEIEGTEHYERALSQGKGMIVATAHLGSFEVGLAVTAAKSPAVHVVFATDPFPRFDRMRRQLREKLGVHEARAEEGWAMWAQLRDALSRGEVVVMQADRVMPGQKGKAVALCGAETGLPTGPVRLAQMTGAPILPVFAVRLADSQIKLIIDEPIVVGDEQAAAVEQQVALERLADVITRRVRDHPDQWLMLHRVWPNDVNRLTGVERH